MSEQTPGPWHVDKTLKRFVYSADGNLIADASDYREYEEALANARLIAAAPDLLVALEAARRAMDELKRRYRVETGGWFIADLLGAVGDDNHWIHIIANAETLTHEAIAQATDLGPVLDEVKEK